MKNMSTRVLSFSGILKHFQKIELIFARLLTKSVLFNLIDIFLNHCERIVKRPW